MVRRYCIN